MNINRFKTLPGILAGLPSEGLHNITATLAPFQTMRCCEQIKVNLGYMRQRICMVGIASGLSLGTLGYTHCCIEDVGILRSIPGITIISPADSLETVKALQAAVKSKNPSYLRLTGSSNNPIVYKEDYEFKIGKSITLKEGKDITIFCAGSMVHQSLEAAKILETKNVSSKVVNMHTIKPIDKLAIDEARDCALIVSVEEHNVIGGLGSAIAEYKSGLEKFPRQLFLGVMDTYTKGGNYKFLQEKHRLTSDKIAEDILSNIK